MENKTLEEAAEIYANQFVRKQIGYANEDFINGAKWMQERSYSEEDLERAFKNGFIISYGIQDVNSIDRKDDYFKEWFEQFKKK